MTSKKKIKRKADAIDGDSAAKKFLEVALSEGELAAEIKKLAALPVSVFETVRVAEAKRLNMRATMLEFLVKAERAKTTKEQKDFLPHWKVEPSSDPVDGAALLDELRQYFNRYAVTPKHADVLLALWALHTWVFNSFDITPYLVITSPTRRCGKSLVLTILQWVCCRAKKNDSMSKAAIYRSVEIERPTLVLDETSWVVDLKDERQGILCGGFERNGFVEVCEGESANITVRRYSTYCPKAFGIIGKLTATLMDRSIEIAMQRKTKLDRVERLGRRDNADYASLRQQCLRWANDSHEALAAIKPKAPDGLNDRELDIWEPLLAIAEHVGGHWPKLARDAAIALSGGESAAEERGVELLRDISTAFANSTWPAMITKRLETVLCSDEERPWATWNKGKPITGRQLAKLLSPFRIISETVHPYETGETKDAKGYKLAHFGDAFDRYLLPVNDASPGFKGSEASYRPNADEMGTSSAFCIRPISEKDGNEKCEKPANHGQKDGRTDKNPVTGNDTPSDDNSGEDDPKVCQHCGAPATPGHPVLPCAVDGEEALLHAACRAGWLGDDPSNIPPFMRRTGAA
jgi:putative DNA primase/helicase